MPPKLLAFDLDGTLLTTDKQLSDANRAALLDMHASGATVALASGRLKSSMIRYADILGIGCAVLALNGAAVYTCAAPDAPPVYRACLEQEFSDELIRYGEGREFAVNFYYEGGLYAVRSQATKTWLDLYVAQTGSVYAFTDTLAGFLGRRPFKMIFVGPPDVLDKEETRFRKLWDGRAYIVRTWDYYLEFLSLSANKGAGLAALAAALDIPMADTAAFGDAANDIPMLRAAGCGIAMANATEETRTAARFVSRWTNDEDAVAREWERMKNGTLTQARDA